MTVFLKNKRLFLKQLSKLSGREPSTAIPNLKTSSDVLNKNEKDCAELFVKCVSPIGVEIQKSGKSLSHDCLVSPIEKCIL